MLKKRISLNKRKSILLGMIMFLLGFSLFSYDYWLSKKNYAFEYMNDKLYLSSHEIPEYVEEKQDSKETKTEKIEENQEPQKIKKPVVVNNYYIGYLEIPKISFKKGFVDINSHDNVLNKNIIVVSGSKYPDVDKGNFIIAGHSGTGINSYFRNLYQLQKKDKVYVYYKNIKYTYEIVNIYDQEKNGSVAIYRNYDKTTLTLITCTKDNHKSQTVYIAELKTKTKNSY